MSFTIIMLGLFILFAWFAYLEQGPKVPNQTHKAIQKGKQFETQALLLKDEVALLRRQLAACPTAQAVETTVLRKLIQKCDHSSTASVSVSQLQYYLTNGVD
jgi:hypothetical protein